MSFLADQLLPHRHVAIFDPGQLSEKLGPGRVVLQQGQFPIEERGVGLVGQMMKPLVRDVVGGLL